MEKPIKLEFSLSKEQSESINDLIKKTGMADTKELFSHALTLLALIEEGKETGKHLALIDEKEKTFTKIELKKN